MRRFLKLGKQIEMNLTGGLIYAGRSTSNGVLLQKLRRQRVAFCVSNRVFDVFFPPRLHCEPAVTRQVAGTSAASGEEWY
jgi:hypothetical protein